MAYTQILAQCIFNAWQMGLFGIESLSLFLNLVFASLFFSVK